VLAGVETGRAGADHGHAQGVVRAAWGAHANREE
jgi:hypothetical protein